MSNLYGSATTYLNKVTTLTASQFNDKVDLFYGDLVSHDVIVSANIFTESNAEMELHVAVDVPEGTEPQEFFASVVEKLVTDAIHSSSLSLQEKVAERIALPA